MATELFGCDSVTKLLYVSLTSTLVCYVVSLCNIAAHILYFICLISTMFPFYCCVITFNNFTVQLFFALWKNITLVYGQQFWFLYCYKLLLYDIVYYASSYRGFECIDVVTILMHFGVHQNWHMRKSNNDMLASSTVIILPVSDQSDISYIIFWDFQFSAPIHFVYIDAQSAK